jgi:CheY-like chemotaxis protein
MYQRVFEFEKFDVDMARNGEEGLQQLSKNKPNMILLDIMMPKMSGIEVLKVIKADPKTKSIPVVVLTNLSGDTDAEVALEMGAVKFIVKSQYKPKQVVEEVQEIIAASTRNELPKTKKY